MRYFLDERSTFTSLVEGKLTLDDMRSQDAAFVFGACKEVIHSINAVPAFVMSHNAEKPRILAIEAEYVDEASLDKVVLEFWRKFKLVIRHADGEFRVTYGDGLNYPGKTLALLQQGHPVFWDNSWRKIDEFKYQIND